MPRCSGSFSSPAWDHVASIRSPGLVITHAGDVLWATAVVLAVAFVRPAWSPYRLCAVGLGLAITIEFSQLWRPRWLEELRDNEVAALVLGKGFVWGDLLRYTLGIAVAFLLLDALRRPRVGQA
jgi:uncharacterized protein DUF2809